MRPGPDNTPRCKRCGFWLEHAENVTEGTDQTAIGVIMMLALVFAGAGAYVWGEAAVVVVAILTVIASLPFSMVPGKRWYCFRCKQHRAKPR